MNQWQKIGIEKNDLHTSVRYCFAKKVDKSIRLTPGFDSGAVVRLSLAGTDLGT